MQPGIEKTGQTHVSPDFYPGYEAGELMQWAEAQCQAKKYQRRCAQRTDDVLRWIGAQFIKPTQINQSDQGQGAGDPDGYSRQSIRSIFQDPFRNTEKPPDRHSR